MASVNQLPDGRWFVQWVKEGKKRRRRYFGRGLDAEMAARRYADSIGGVGRRTPPPPPTACPLFEDLAQEYLKARAGVMTETTRDRLMHKLLAVLLPAFGHMEANRITAAAIDRFVLHRMKEVKRTTIHRELSDMRAILNFAVHRDYLMSHVLNKYDLPARDDDIILPATESEVRLILSKAAPHVRRAIVLAWYLGVRPGAVELLPIRWTDVDFDQELMHVRSARKGGPVSRTVPLHSALYEQLACWYEEDVAAGAAGGEIIRWKGRAVSAIRQAFNRAKVRAGITRRLPLYALRHAFATMALNAGGDAKHVSQIMGHSREDTTRRIYQHTSLTHSREAVDKLPDITRSKVKK